jgi:fatty-acyl-CoA synthase
VKAGFDPNQLHDPLYWFDPATARFEPLTQAIYAAILSGKIKL